MQWQLFFFLNEYSRYFFWEVSLEMFCIVVINKQKYCFERKNWVAIQAKKIMLSFLYHFWEKNTGIENIYKTRKKSTKSRVDSCYLAIFLERCPFRSSHRSCSTKKVSLKISQIPQVKHLCWSLFRQWQQLEVFCRKRCS